MKKTVLVVAYGGGHMIPLVPVVKDLEKKSYTVKTLALTSACENAKSGGIDFKSYKDYFHLNGNDQELAKKYGEELAKDWHNPNSPVSYEESVAYLGTNFLEVVKTHGEELAYELLKKIGRHCFYPINFLKKIIKLEKPDLVLTTNSPKSERASISAAKELGIKSIRFEDLYIDTNVIDTNIKILGKNLYKETIGKYDIEPTKVAVMSNYSKSLYLKNSQTLGIISPESDVVVTGQPILEVVEEQMKEKQTYDLIPSRKDKLTLCWVHQNETPDQKEVFDIVIEWFKNYSENFNLVIKLHPNIKNDDFDKINSKFSDINKYANLRFIKKELDPNYVLWNSDIIISQESTMMTQASVMGKPLLTLNPTNERPNCPHVKVGGSSFINSSAEVQSHISKLKREFQGIENTKKNAFGIPPNAAKNISDLVDQVLS